MSDARKRDRASGKDVKALENELLEFGHANYKFDNSKDVDNQDVLDHEEAYVPSTVVANAASDVQLLAYAHRDGMYVSQPPILDVPRNMWVLFSKTIQNAQADAPAAVCVRVRELFDSVPVVECAAVAVSEPGPTHWRLFPVQNCINVDEKFETLSSAVVFLRQLSQMSSLLPMHQDYQNITMPGITCWLWVGDQFCIGGDPDPDTLTSAVLENNEAVFKDLLAAPSTSPIRLREEAFTQPHVWIGRLVYKGCSFSVGFVTADSVWIVLHACQNWVRASYSLAELLSSLNK